ncbi:MAG: isoamylase early set domain-containing protein [Thermodesulfobacteriota bacterium]
MAQNQKSKRRKVNFSLDAPDAEHVCLSGDFNGWDRQKHPMKKSNNGSWQLAMMLPPGRYEYRFLVDDRWTNDLQNPETSPNCYGTFNNVVSVPEDGS